MYPYSHALAENGMRVEDVARPIEVYLSIYLRAHGDEVLHLPCRHREIGLEVSPLAHDELEVVETVFLEADNLAVRGVNEYKTVYHRYLTHNLPAVDGAQLALLGYEKSQSVSVSIETLLGFPLILVGTHDIPLCLLVDLYVCHSLYVLAGGAWAAGHPAVTRFYYICIVSDWLKKIQRI